LLEHDASVRVRNKGGRTPLHFASASHFVNADVVALLLKLGADVDARDSADMTPLLCALDSFPSDEVVRLLLEHGASVHVRNKDGRTPLHFASASDQIPPDVVASLLKLGADVDALDNDNMTPLLCVFESFGSGEVAQLLMEHGASVHVRNKKSQTPLHLASGWCHSDVLASLLKLGADVDSRDSDDMTPLLHALVHWNHSPAVKLLLEHGASAHVRNKSGQMPLHLASQSRRSDVVTLLLNSGADVDAQDSNYMTPLHFAMSSHSPYRFIECDTEGNIRVMRAESEVEMDEEALRVIELLLEHGANVHLQNDRGKTPLQTASVKMKHELEQSLSRYSQND
jgi:ankyrin repeat protein